MVTPLGGMNLTPSLQEAEGQQVTACLIKITVIIKMRLK